MDGINQIGQSVSTETKKRNDWKILSGILAIVIVILFVYMFYSGGITGNAISGDDASTKVVEYLNGRTGGGVEYVSHSDKGDLYEVMVKYQGQSVPVYVTKDGEYFVQGAISMGESKDSASDTEDTSDTSADVPKSDKPKVELFVMTHCPYGLQAEKGFIPAIKALGSKADMKIRFVGYFMHGDKEEAETYNQVCIREEQSAKFLDYVSCFTEAGDSAACLTKVGVDKTKLDACLANDKKKAKEYYAIDKELGDGYGVQGSPTLIVNGAEANSGRSADAYLKTVCGAFNTAPTTECSKTLSTSNPGAGFGTAAASGSASAAQCG